MTRICVFDTGVFSGLNAPGVSKSNKKHNSNFDKYIYNENTADKLKV